MNGFVTDTISLDRLTIIGGIRFDHQESSLGAASVPGVPGIPVLPALNAPAVPGVFKWNNVTPRVGITYAVDEARKTVVARQLRDVRVAAAGRRGEVRLADSVLLRVLQRGGQERRRRRAAERDPVQPGAAGLLGLRSEQPDPPVDGEHGRSERQGADHARVPDRHRQGADAELLGQRHLHLPPDGRPDLGSADRRQAVRLHADRHAHRQHSPSSAPTACRSTR